MKHETMVIKMADDLYDIVFKGELVRSFELSSVKKNVGQLFKVEGAKLDALFSGKAIILKRNLNFDTASKYRVAIKKAGARVDLVPVEKKEAAPDTPPANASSKAVFGEAPTAPEPAVAESKRDKDYGFTLAPVGAEVLNASEKVAQEVVEVDVSGLSVRDAGGDLLEPSEKRQFEELDINLEGVEMAPVGDDLLSEEEKKKVDEVSVDTSALSIAEPGVRLSKPSPEPPPAPDVSGITLEP